MWAATAASFNRRASLAANLGSDPLPRHAAGQRQHVHLHAVLILIERRRFSRSKFKGLASSSPGLPSSVMALRYGSGVQCVCMSIDTGRFRGCALAVHPVAKPVTTHAPDWKNALRWRFIPPAMIAESRRKNEAQGGRAYGWFTLGNRHASTSGLPGSASRRDRFSFAARANYGWKVRGPSGIHLWYTDSGGPARRLYFCTRQREAAASGNIRFRHSRLRVTV